MANLIQVNCCKMTKEILFHDSDCIWIGFLHVSDTTRKCSVSDKVKTNCLYLLAQWGMQCLRQAKFSFEAARRLELPLNESAVSGWRIDGVAKSIGDDISLKCSNLIKKTNVKSRGLF